MMNASPRLRVEAACLRLGRDDFISRCVALLGGGDEESDFIVTLGGQPALRLLAAAIPEDQGYWLRVWAARGLLWAGPGREPGVLRPALQDVSWRVREMTCKVIARHCVGDLLESVAVLEVDPVMRVQRAATLASRRILEVEK